VPIGRLPDENEVIGMSKIDGRTIQRLEGGPAGYNALLVPEALEILMIAGGCFRDPKVPPDSAPAYALRDAVDPTEAAAFHCLQRAGLIVSIGELRKKVVHDGIKGYYETTPLGRAHLDQLLKVAFPERSEVFRTEKGDIYNEKGRWTGRVKC
jgi:hypothetical protein